MDQLRPEIRELSSLKTDEVQSMYSLLIKYYDSCEYEQFICDLQDKDYIVMLKNCNGILQGFSTAKILSYKFKGQMVRAVFSGDTIIHNDYWGSQALPLAWCYLVGKIKAEMMDVPLYWFLIVKGHRTYRYLSLFSKKFYPTWRHDTPGHIKELINHLASERFGDAYDPQKSIVRFKSSQGHLREEWADIPDHLSRKNDVKYFLQRNPGFSIGDELVCLTELCQSNLRSFALRAFNKGIRGESLYSD
ncbi:MAG: hypothetical protein QNL62_11835 [Gammaproteobacteria bacterium]|nr:hypothetical protein [Gammaproteobacteria bacterium]